MSLLSTIAWTLLTGGVLLAACVAIEQVATIERFPLKARIRGIVFSLVATPLSLVLAWVLQGWWQKIGVGHVFIPLTDWLKPAGPIAPFLYFFILVAAVDFCAYWRHRFEHSRLIWPIHAVHHSATELHGANNWGHPVQIIPHLVFVTFPMSLVQFQGPGTPVAVGLLVSFMTLYIHSPIDVHLGPLRRVIVDNRFHRIHHSVEPQHWEKNFGILLSVWDWLFRTAYWPKPNEWPKVGIDRPPPVTVKDFLLYPLSFADRRRSEPKIPNPTHSAQRPS